MEFIELILLNIALFLILTYIIILLIISFVPNAHSYARFISIIILYYLHFQLVSFFTLPILLMRPRDPINFIIFSKFVKCLKYLFKLEFELRVSNDLSKSKGCVIVTNHQNILDLLGFYVVCEKLGKAVLVVKKELLYSIPYGLSLYLSGAIFIQRQNGKASIQTLLNARQLMTESNQKIVICPEGTTNSTNEPMLSFKKGAFLTAIQAQVQIVPLVISPYYFLDKKTHYIDFGGKIIIETLEPISTKGLTTDDVPMLTKKVKNQMLECYAKLSEELKSVTKHSKK